MRALPCLLLLLFDSEFVRQMPKSQSSPPELIPAKAAIPLPAHDEIQIWPRELLLPTAMPARSAPKLIALPACACAFASCRRRPTTPCPAPGLVLAAAPRSVPPGLHAAWEFGIGSLSFWDRAAAVAVAVSNGTCVFAAAAL